MRRSLLVAAVVALAAGCGGSDNGGSTGPPGPPPTAITVQATTALAFVPSPATVASGGTVTFAFGAVGHNVFFDPKPGAPADITGSNANVSIDRTFPTAGTYVYNCHIHPGMTGTIVVK